jgi:2-phospho-L-lactate guanylyltransferase
MRTIAILPIKSFDAAKQRLASALGGGARHALAQAMFSDVLAALRRARCIEAVAVVTDSHEAEASVRGQGVLVLPEDRPAGQSEAALIGIRHATAAGFDRALLVPGDAPLADPAALDLLLGRGDLDELDVLIVPDRHGTGTNALLLAPPDALEPRFGGHSLERHVAAAEAAGRSHHVEAVDSLAHDVDTPEDLADLSAVLDERRAVAPRTRGALRQIDRLQPGFADRASRPTVDEAVHA